MAWLCRAQDESASADGGVSRHYSLLDGWATSYPETTGYIVPTFLTYGELTASGEYEVRARRMLDWLCSIQYPEGAFQGGKIDSSPKVPVTFNTGQILLGLAAAAARFEAYLEPMKRAADWLSETQEDDGCWRAFATPFASPGEKVYETHVSWGLIEAARVQPHSVYAEKAMKNIRWALSFQRDNGWFANCCLVQPRAPLTHTIGYALRGVIEGYTHSRDSELLEAAIKAARGIMGVVRTDGFLPGRLNDAWCGTVDWACLTGSVQIAHCLLLLHRVTGVEQYREVGFLLNRFVRRTIHMNGSPDLRGGVKGSFPVDGGYGRYEMLNWGAKFFVDSNLLEIEIRNEAS